MNDGIDSLIFKLERLVRDGSNEPVETDVYELKPVPSLGSAWLTIQESANAFLNTRGGVLILGIKENTGAKKTASWRRYEFTGWSENNEENVKRIAKVFIDQEGHSLDLSDRFRPLVIRSFLNGQVALQYVDELPACSVSTAVAQIDPGIKKQLPPL